MNLAFARVFPRLPRYDGGSETVLTGPVDHEPS